METTTQAILATGAVVGALGVIVSRLRHFFLWARRAVVAWEAMERLIQKELTPNSGSSLKDKINSIDSRVSVLEAAAARGSSHD